MSEEEKKPLITELAKSSRSSCRGCRNKINKGDLRAGIPFKFTIESGKEVFSYGYYHIHCVPKSHQDEVLHLLEKNDLVTKNEVFEIRKNIIQSASDTPKLDEAPFLEVSKSSRSSCRLCESKLLKDEYRVAEPSKIELSDGRVISGHKYYHLNCFLDSQKNSKEIFSSIIQESLRRNILTPETIENIKSSFYSTFKEEDSASLVLRIIGETPISIEIIKQKAKEMNVNFNIVEKVLKQRLEKGEIFEPQLNHFQKL
ncbi:hypothetical protein [Candidatus Hodarchaeum mangrovi]